MFMKVYKKNKYELDQWFYACNIIMLDTDHSYKDLHFTNNQTLHASILAVNM